MSVGLEASTFSAALRTSLPLIALLHVRSEREIKRSTLSGDRSPLARRSQAQTAAPMRASKGDLPLDGAALDEQLQM